MTTSFEPSERPRRPERAPLKPGVLSSEFWLVVALLVTGAGLAFYDPTRELGAALLGVVAREVQTYLRARTEIKLARLAEDDG